MSHQFTAEELAIIKEADEELSKVVLPATNSPSRRYDGTAYILPPEFAISRFLSNVVEIPIICEILDENSITDGDGIYIIWGLISPLLPNPTIKLVDGNSILVPTLFIMEPWRLKALCRDFKKFGNSPKRVDFLATVAKDIYRTHSKARGVGSLVGATNKNTGCAPLLVFLFLGVSLGGFLLHRFL